MKITPLLSALLLVGHAAATELTDAEYEQLREEALARPRRIFADNDGCDVTAYPAGKPLTREGILAYMNDWIKNCEVDTLTYCPGGVGQMMSYPTRIGDRYYIKLHIPSLVNQTEALHKMGTDGLKIAVDFARANGLEILANMRINDQHERWAPVANHAPFKRAHPEYLLGTNRNSPPYGSWLLFDFNRPEVRERFRAIVNEMLTDYDVDGLIIDFYRHPVLFPSVAGGGAATPEETALITRLLRDIRADADAAGKKRRRYQLLTIRVPDSAEMCRAIGVDLDQICAEKLIDFLVVGGDDGLVSTRAEAVKIGQNRGLKTYVSIDAFNGSVPQMRDTPELYAAMAASAYAAGADGLYYFNTFYHPWVFKEVRRDPRDLRFMPKNYWGRYHRRADFSGMCDSLNHLAATDGTDLVLEPGKAGRVMIETGDDFSDPEVAARHPEITLTVHTAPGLPRLAASVNGTELAPPTVENNRQSFTVPTTAMRRGENMIELTLTEPAGESIETIFTGQEVVRYNSARPWRRLWPFYKSGVSEKVVDGAVRLDDFGTGPGDCMNLYYPLPASARHLEGEFELKVDYSNAPEAVALRLANGENVELITFEPDVIKLKFAGKSRKFATADRFHTYGFRMKSGRLEFYADGEQLFDEKLSLRADEPRARFTGNNDGLPHMYDRSLIVGSLSESGTGASQWKNFRLRNSAMVNAVELQVAFPAPPDEGILAAIGVPGRTVADFSVASGNLPADWNSSYAPERMQITPEKTLKLDNNDPDNIFALISGNQRDYLKAKTGILRVSWRVKPGECGNNNSSFQLAIRPDLGGKLVRSFAVSMRPGVLITPWRSLPVSGEFIQGELYYNFATGAGAVVLDGKIAATGPLQETQAPSLIFFGDGGSNCGGEAEVDFIKVEVID